MDFQYHWPYGPPPTPQNYTHFFNACIMHVLQSMFFQLYDQNFQFLSSYKSQDILLVGTQCIITHKGFGIWKGKHHLQAHDTQGKLTI